MTNLDSDITLLRHQFADKGPYSQSYGFSSSRVQCESWTIKKTEGLRIMLLNVVLEKALDLDWRFLGLQGYKTSQSWSKSILNIHWKDWCWCQSSNTLTIWFKELTHWKRPWCWEILKGTKEDEILGYHHLLSRNEFDQTLGDGEGQGSLEHSSPWDHKDLDSTEWLKNSNNNET